MTKVDNKDNTIKITSEDGAIYEFYKPEFECELIDCRGGLIIGWVQYDSCTWKQDGKSISHNGYHLTPIKKEWYEYPENFPKLIYLREEGHERDRMRPELLVNIDDYEFYCEGTVKKFEWRLATKEEVLSLYHEGKN